MAFGGHHRVLDFYELNLLDERMFDILKSMAATHTAANPVPPETPQAPTLHELRRMMSMPDRVEMLGWLVDSLERDIGFDAEATGNTDPVEMRLMSNAVQAANALRAAEHARRLAFAVVLRTIDEVRESHVVDEHGHASAKAMCAAVNRLSGRDVYGIEQILNMNRGCPDIKEACFNADLSEDHLRLLARVYANRRVRAAFKQEQGWFLNKAARFDFKRFKRLVERWTQNRDVDGAEPNIAHESRGASSSQDLFTGAFQRHSTQGPIVGAAMDQIDQAYVQAEFAKDWEAAQAIHGDKTCKEHLARTDAQRRADAQAQIYADAVANPNRSKGFRIDHFVVWDSKTYEEMVRRFAGAAPRPFDIDTMQCHTSDGHLLEPNEAFLDSLVNGVRRVVVDAKGVTIDMSEKRFFTGFARTALQIGHDECEWPGCHVPSSRCEADHTTPRSRGGPTIQENASLFCKRHNRHKERGYTVWRDPTTGSIRIVTPAGVDISD